MSRSIIGIFLLGLLLNACGRTVPEFTGIDFTVWKEDKKGCNGQRAAALSSLQEQKNKLQGLTEMQLLTLLGRPDEQELYKRNQKFYYYWLEPGKLCGRTAVARKLSIRFNATGAAKEISIE